MGILTKCSTAASATTTTPPPSSISSSSSSLSPQHSPTFQPCQLLSNNREHFEFDPKLMDKHNFDQVRELLLKPKHTLIISRDEYNKKTTEIYHIIVSNSYRPFPLFSIILLLSITIFILAQFSTQAKAVLRIQFT